MLVAAASAVHEGAAEAEGDQDGAAEQQQQPGAHGSRAGQARVGAGHRGGGRPRADSAVSAARRLGPRPGATQHRLLPLGSAPAGSTPPRALRPRQPRLRLQPPLSGPAPVPPQAPPQPQHSSSSGPAQSMGFPPVTTPFLAQTPMLRPLPASPGPAPSLSKAPSPQQLRPERVVLGNPDSSALPAPAAALSPAGWFRSPGRPQITAFSARGPRPPPFSLKPSWEPIPASTRASYADRSHASLWSPQPQSGSPRPAGPRRAPVVSLQGPRARWRGPRGQRGAVSASEERPAGPESVGPPRVAAPPQPSRPRRVGSEAVTRVPGSRSRSARKSGCARSLATEGDRCARGGQRAFVR